MDDISAGITAWKMLVEALRGTLGLAKEIKDAAPDGPQRKAFEKAVEQLDESADRVKLALAKEWGYPLCHCEFPPVIMLRCDHRHDFDDYECPKCKIIERHGR